jgi:hypothetical protein
VRHGRADIAAIRAVAEMRGRHALGCRRVARDGWLVAAARATRNPWLNAILGTLLPLVVRDMGPPLRIYVGGCGTADASPATERAPTLVGVRAEEVRSC